MMHFYVILLIFQCAKTMCYTYVIPIKYICCHIHKVKRKTVRCVFSSFSKKEKDMYIFLVENRNFD